MKRKTHLYLYWRNNSEDIGIKAPSLNTSWGISDSESIPLLENVMQTCLWCFLTHCLSWPNSRPHDPDPLPNCTGPEVGTWLRPANDKLVTAWDCYWLEKVTQANWLPV